MKKIFVSFLLILTLVCNSPVCAYASSFGGGGGTHDMTGFNNWDIGDKVGFWSTNLPAIIAGSIGLVINPLNWNYDTWLNTFLKSANNMGVALESDNYYDYVANMLSVNDNNELVVSDELTDIMYNASVQYIEEETGFRVHETVNATEYALANINKFKTNSQYRTFLNFCADNSDKLIICSGLFSNFANCYASDSADSVTVIDGLEFKVVSLKDTQFYCKNGSSTYVYPIDSEWNAQTLECYIIGTDGIVYSCPTRNSSGNFSTVLTGYNYNKTNYRYYDYNGIPKNIDSTLCIAISITIANSNYMITHGGQFLRVYNSFDDLKQYSVGQRPYYITDAFKNYDSTVDNSTTITQTEIDNSVTYGDVYNYITNNYDNPDGLSEDELRAILAEYLASINNSGGSGSGSGSGDSGGSGSGLSGFLDGLGSLGDALLAIIGKLLEYVGKAIELLSGTVTKVIDLVPTTITAILGAIFSFFPQEWMTAIELALVLGVVIGIVGLLRK